MHHGTPTHVLLLAELHVSLQTRSRITRHTYWQVFWIHPNKSQCLGSSPTHRNSLDFLPPHKSISSSSSSSSPATSKDTCQ